MTYLPDYNDLAADYNNDLDIAEENLPECERCGEKIYDHGYFIDGQVICEYCADEWLEGKKIGISDITKQQLINNKPDRVERG